MEGKEEVNEKYTEFMEGITPEEQTGSRDIQEPSEDDPKGKSDEPKEEKGKLAFMEIHHNPENDTYTMSSETFMSFVNNKNLTEQ